MNATNKLHVALVKSYLGIGDCREDGFADQVGVAVELKVIQQEAGGQQHGRGVCRVPVSDALPSIPGALYREEHI